MYLYFDECHTRTPTTSSVSSRLALPRRPPHTYTCVRTITETHKTPQLILSSINQPTNHACSQPTDRSPTNITFLFPPFPFPLPLCPYAPIPVLPPHYPLHYPFSQKPLRQTRLPIQATLAFRDLSSHPIKTSDIIGSLAHTHADTTMSQIAQPPRPISSPTTTRHAHPDAPARDAPAALLHTKVFPALELAFEALRLLLLLAELTLRPPRRQLVVALGRLELVNGAQELLDPVAEPRRVLRQLRRLLVLAVDLRLEVLDGAIDVAHGPCGLGALCLLSFEL